MFILSKQNLSQSSAKSFFQRVDIKVPGFIRESSFWGKINNSSVAGPLTYLLVVGAIAAFGKETEWKREQNRKVWGNTAFC